MTTIVSIEPLGTLSADTETTFPAAVPLPVTAPLSLRASLPSPLSEPLEENARLTVALDKALSDVRQLVSGSLQQATPAAPVAAETPVTAESRPFPEECLLRNLLPTELPPLPATAEDGDSPSLLSREARSVRVLQLPPEAPTAVDAQPVAVATPVAAPQVVAVGQPVVGDESTDRGELGAFVLPQSSEKAGGGFQPPRVTVASVEKPVVEPVVVEARPVVIEASAAVEAKPVAVETPAVAEVKPVTVETSAVVEAKLVAVEASAAVEAKPVAVEAPAAVEAKPVAVETPAVAEAKPVAVEAPARENTRRAEVAQTVETPTVVKDDVALPRSKKASEIPEVSSEAAAAALTAAGIVPGAEIAIAAQRVVEAAAPAAPMTASAVSPDALPSQVLVETAQVVADTLIVTPGLMRGQGEVTVQLKNDVLQGSQVTIAVHGRQLEVIFLSASADVATLVERNFSQIQEYLGSRIHSFNVGVKLRKTRG